MLGLGNSIAHSSYVSGAAPKLLDTVGGAAVAYSLRLLNNSYGGNAINVRRDSDNAEANIGFAGGELDTKALSDHCGSANGFVDTWFDQSGNGNDAVQEDATNQSQIVSSGTINTDSDGNVFIDMMPSQLPLGVSISQPFHIVTAWKAVNDRRFLSGSGFGYNIQSDYMRIVAGSPTLTGTIAVDNTKKNCTSAAVGSGSGVLRMNGSVDVSDSVGTNAIPSNAIVFSRLNIADWGPEQSYEFIIFDSVQASIADIEANVMTYYNIS